MTTQSNGTNVNDFESRYCAAEEAALQLGWLCECPYHGEPFRAPGVRSAGQEIDAGNEIVMLATQLSQNYAEHCPLCMRESTIPE